MATPSDPIAHRSSPAQRPGTLWLPEAVSRLSQTPALLRGLSALVGEHRDFQVLMSTEDRTDHIWKGTTWEAIAGVRGLLGGLVERVSATPPADMVVLGDPFAVPGEELEAIRAAGTPIVVAAGSVAASRWPEATTWWDEDSLVAAVTSGVLPEPASPPVAPAMSSRSSDPSRAQRVSVGIPIFQEAAFLDECVESVISQTQSPFEVILVDDGSTEAAVAAAVERWSSHPLVSVMRQHNRGVSVARNSALERMQGDAFVFVDADDLLHSDFISDCAGGLRANPQLWAVASWTEFFEDYEGVEAKPPFDRRVGMRENPIVSTSALVAMEVRDAGIRFAPDLAFLYCEDWDVWSQIVAAGGSFGLVPRPLVKHRVHRTSGGHQRTTLGHSLGQARATRHLMTSGATGSGPGGDS